MNTLGSSNISDTAEALDEFMDEIDMKKLTAFSKATEGLMTGQMLAQLQVENNQAGGGGGNTTIIQNTSTNQVNSSQPTDACIGGIETILTGALT